MNLYPDQIENSRVLRALSDARGAALDLSDMGVGKSAIGLDWLDARRPTCLIVPACLRGKWTDEIEAWHPGRWAIHHVEAIGSFRWPALGEIVLLSRELIQSSGAEIVRLERAVKEAENAASDSLDFIRATAGEDHKKKLARAKKARGTASPPPDGMQVLVDEAHVFSNNKSLMTQRARSIFRAVRKGGGRILGLTATPLLNDPLELNGFLTTFGLHHAAYGDWWGFLRAWGGHKGVFAYEFTGEPRDAEVAAGLQRVGIRRLLDRVRPGIPPYAPVQIRDVEADEGVAALERAAAEDPRLAKLHKRGLDVYAYMEGGAKPRGLGQDTARVAFEHISRIGAALAAAKVPAATAWAEEMEAAGEPALIGSPYAEPIRLLGARPGWGTITGTESAAERHRVVRAFAAGQLRGIAATIRAGGVGIDCQRAAHVLLTDPDWVPSWTRQFLARARRTGQTRAVTPWFLRVAEHPIETRKQEIVRVKRRYLRAVDAAAVA